MTHSVGSWWLVVLAVLVSCGERPASPAPVAPGPSGAGARGPEETRAVLTRTRDRARDMGAQENPQPTRVAVVGRAQPPAAATIAQPGRIFGRVVDVRTGEGIAGATVRLRLRKTPKQVQVTEDDGNFSFVPAVEPRSAGLYVIPPPGWRWITPDRNSVSTLTKEQREGREELCIKVAENRTGPVHGIAVDQLHGAPLPSFAFSIAFPAANRRGKPDRVEVVTDDLGRFRIDHSVRGGRVGVSPSKGGARAVRQKQDCLIPEVGSPPWSIVFAAGPRLELELRGAVPEDPTGLDLLLLYAGEKRVRSRTGLRVDADGAVWARPPYPRGLEAGSRVVLAVLDPAGFVFGARSMELPDAEPLTPLVLELERTAVLKLEVEQERPDRIELVHSVAYRVEGDRFVPVEQDPWWREPAVLRELVRLDRRGALPAATLRLSAGRWLPPGPYELTVSTRLHQEQVFTPVLEAGRVKQLSVTLTPVKLARTVRGTARTETGGPLKDFKLTLSLVEHPECSWITTYERHRFCGNGMDHGVLVEEVDETELGTFLFEAVPAGAVSVRAWSQSVACAVEVRETDSGDLAVDVVQLDGAGDGYGFRVRMPDGSPAKGFTVGTRPRDGGSMLFDKGRNEEPIARGVPEARSLEWAVWRRGTRPVYGTQADFLPEGGGRFFAQVQLESGWGTRILVCDPNGTPLLGADVMVDGERAGVTDPRGQLELERAQRPDSIEVRYRDWSLVGDGDAKLRRQTNAANWWTSGPTSGWHEVILAPR